MKLSLKDDVNSVSYFKSHFPKMLRKARTNRRPMIITQNGKSAGVFMDIETWENQIKKMNLLSLIIQGEASYKNDRRYTLDEVKELFAKKYDL
jgi:prevent-host-death family protein